MADDATRAAYDATAEFYARVVGTEVSPDFEGPLDRALLAAFAEVVQTRAGVVADIGCGPGRVAAFLAARGVEVVGVDHSISMLTVARAAHPGIRFEEGRLSALPFDIASIGAAVCWYSVIHTAPADLDEVFAELHRVLVPDGPLLIGFQAGAGERVERTVGDDETTALLISYRHAPDDVADRLTTAGFRTHGRAVRERELPHETSPQAFLLAMKGAA